MAAPADDVVVPEPRERALSRAGIGLDPNISLKVSPHWASRGH
jgi:hypothetical protein